MAGDICAACAGSILETKAGESVRGSKRAMCMEQGQLGGLDAGAEDVGPGSGEVAGNRSLSK